MSFFDAMRAATVIMCRYFFYPHAIKMREILNIITRALKFRRHRIIVKPEQTIFTDYPCERYQMTIIVYVNVLDDVKFSACDKRNL